MEGRRKSVPYRLTCGAAPGVDVEEDGEEEEEGAAVMLTAAAAEAALESRWPCRGREERERRGESGSLSVESDRAVARKGVGADVDAGAREAESLCCKESLPPPGERVTALSSNAEAKGCAMEGKAGRKGAVARAGSGLGGCAAGGAQEEEGGEGAGWCWAWPCCTCRGESEG